MYHGASKEAPSMAGSGSLDRMPRVISFMSSLLERVASSNDSIEEGVTQKLSAFHGLTRPSISIHSYLERIFKYANCSPSCFVVAYVYLDRFAQKQPPSWRINSLNIHRLLVTSVMVSAKFVDDMFYNNAYYARVGGISTREMNCLELEFLFGLGFHLNVTPNTFQFYGNHLNREMLLDSSPSLTTTKPLNHHSSFSEDESTSRKQQLAV